MIARLREITKLVKAGKNARRGSRANAPKNFERQAIPITPALLRRWPLPQPDEAGDKETRGRVLIVGGEGETPGAVILAATGALRVGAGKLRIATGRSIALPVAVSVLEARVMPVPETKKHVIAASADEEIIDYSKDARAVLVGPGMIDEAAAARLAQILVSRVESATLVLDAAALALFKKSKEQQGIKSSKLIITPNADEMSEMLGISKSIVSRDPLTTARRAATKFGAVVVMKGHETIITSPRAKEIYSNRAGNVGLATSGSGDVLAGMIAGLAARGAAPLQAAVWGVHLHARAGDRLAKRIGRLGFLARELLKEIPGLMSELGGKKR